MRTKEQKDGRRENFMYFLLALVLITMVVVTPIQGQETKFPSKPVEILVTYAPGGIIDVVNRIFAESLSRELKVPVVIRNQAGGGGLTGATAFVGMKPDGYTVLSTSGAAITSCVLLSQTPPFDPRKDLLPVGLLGVAPVAMAVAKASPFKSFEDFVRYAKSNPGKLIVGVSDLGSETHFMTMCIIKDTKIDVKIVPFVGSGPITAALMGGHIDWKCSSLPSTMGYVNSGDLRVLLLTRRSKNLPDVPAGPDVGLPSVSINIWVGYYVRPETPKAAYDRLVSAIEVVSKNPEVIKKLDATGLDTDHKGPKEASNSGQGLLGNLLPSY